MKQTIEERVKILEKKVLVLEGGTPLTVENPYKFKKGKEEVKDNG